jgi:hypothetical protein
VGSADYRYHAINCLCTAAEISDPKAKALLLFMAGAWNNLADHADRNSTVAFYGTPPRRQLQQPVGPNDLRDGT